jgi:3-phosphoshikimate 1-carboxyvinyltransferase
MMQHSIPPSIKADINLPASKSLSNRALMIQAISHQAVQIESLSPAHDTVLLQQILQKVDSHMDFKLIDVEDAGTPFRFLVAYLSAMPDVDVIITGTKRLQERPIAPLVDALRSIGASITYIGDEGFAPMQISGKALKGGDVYISGKISSQFISALCLIGPTLTNGLKLHSLDEWVSAPYIHMTLLTMQQCGIQYSINNKGIAIPHQSYQSRLLRIEKDWSSAAFFYALAMICENITVNFPALNVNSLQGDMVIQKLAAGFGIQTICNDEGCYLTRISEIEPHISARFNLCDCPDAAIPFIVACAVQYPNVRIEGIEHLEWKESKRISALTSELSKIGIKLTYQNGILSFQHPRKEMTVKTVHFKSYHDHRIVMALSLLAVTGIDIYFDDISCVQKSFPDFFTELDKTGLKKSIYSYAKTE